MLDLNQMANQSETGAMDSPLNPGASQGSDSAFQPRRQSGRVVSPVDSVSAQPANKSSATPSQGSVPGSMDAFEQRVVELTNQFRRQNGLSDLAVNSQLSQAAEKHSLAMAQQDFFDHTGKDGSTLTSRLQAENYNFSRAAENIAAGQQTPEEVVQAWIDSAGHRQNLLNGNLKEIGVGFVDQPNDTGNVNFKTYWTQNFGTKLA